MKKIKAGHFTWTVFRKLAFWQTLFIVISSVSIVMLCRYYFKQNFINQVEVQLKNNLSVLSPLISNNKVSFSELCLSFKNVTGERLTVVEEGGNVVCDSSYDKSQMSNHINRDEIQDAIKSNWGWAVRYSNTLKIDMFYGAIKIMRGGKPFYVRKSVPISNLDSTLKAIDNSIFIFITPLLVIVSFLSLWFNFIYRSEEERKVNKLKEDLISNISHEVRTPLTAMKGYIQILLSDNGTAIFSSEEFLKKIELNIEKLSSLFSDLLDLSNIEKGKPVVIEEIDVDTLVDSILDNLAIKYQERQITVDCKDLRLENFRSDQLLLENIFSNLIENAYKYNQQGGRIEIFSSIEPNQVTFTVKDNGIGIPGKSLPHIFERFYCVDESRSSEYGSTGLGLAIAKHAVLKLDGDIWADSKVGEGTAFSFTIPL